MRATTPLLRSAPATTPRHQVLIVGSSLVSHASRDDRGAVSLREPLQVLCAPDRRRPAVAPDVAPNSSRKRRRRASVARGLKLGRGNALPRGPSRLDLGSPSA